MLMHIHCERNSGSKGDESNETRHGIFSCTRTPFFEKGAASLTSAMKSQTKTFHHTAVHSSREEKLKVRTTVDQNKEFPSTRMHKTTKGTPQKTCVPPAATSHARHAINLRPRLKNPEAVQRENIPNFQKEEMRNDRVRPAQRAFYMTFSALTSPAIASRISCIYMNERWKRAHRC